MKMYNSISVFLIFLLIIFYYNIYVDNELNHYIHHSFSSDCHYSYYYNKHFPCKYLHIYVSFNLECLNNYSRQSMIKIIAAKYHNVNDIIISNYRSEDPSNLKLERYSNFKYLTMAYLFSFLGIVLITS